VTADDEIFDWDEANVEHIARHGVKPEEAEEVFQNDPVDIDFEVVNGEDRWTAIGHTNALRVLFVVWTMRAGAIRLITARTAGTQYRAQYLKERGF
jgi:uncharacterized protein